MSRAGLLLGIAAVIFGACFLLYVKNRHTTDYATSNFSRAFHDFVPYDNAPVLPSLRMAGPAGTDIGLEDFRGKYVLLNFWATWCGPCIGELPSLQALKDHYKREDFDVIAVSVDTPDKMDQVAGFLEKNHIGNVAYYHDYKAQLQNAFIFKLLPTTYLISPEGRVLYEMTGPANWDSSPVIAFLNQFQTAKN